MLNDIILSDIKNVYYKIEGNNRLAGKRIMITGASGLVGTYFLAYMVYLKKIGIPITIFAQTFSDPPPHMLELLNQSYFNILKLDLSNFDDYKKLPKVDIVFHAACYAQPMLFMANSIATIQLNTTATLEMLKTLKPGGTLIFTSSSEVYCGLSEIKSTEENIGTTTPYHPRASYIEGKRCGEALCNIYRGKGYNAISVRLADSYGPGTRINDKKALNSFIQRGILNKNITLMDLGQAMRVYCYISDTLEILINILLNGKQAVYNVGGESYTSIANLAKTIGSILNVPVIFPENSNMVSGSPDILLLDLTKIKEEFGKTNYVNLVTGLEKTIEWQTELYKLEGLLK